MADEAEVVKQGQESTTSQDVNATESSIVEKQTATPPGIGDVVKGVLDKHLPKEGDTAAKAGEEGSVKESNQTEEEKEESVEAKKEESSTETEQSSDEQKHEEAVPYERFHEVNEKLREATEKVTQFEETAKRMQGIDEFLNQYGVTAQQFQETLGFLALLRTDPAQARSMLQPLVEQLDITTGSRLPQDLQVEVDDGKLTVERAKEIAQLRLSKGSLEQQGRLTAEQMQQQQVQRVVNTMNAWDMSKRKTDPSFKPKANSEPVGRYEEWAKTVHWLITTRKPQNEQDYVKCLNDAYDEVLSFEKRFATKPVAKKVLSSTSTSSTTAPKIDITKPGWEKDVARSVFAKHVGA